MLDGLITSKTRIKLLVKFFSNRHCRGYLRSLAEEFSESTNSVRLELNRLTDAGLLTTASEGNTKVYKANTTHPLFPELHSLALKYFGLDKVVDSIVSKLGDVELALITGDYAQGIDSGLIDLILIGKVDGDYLLELIAKAEQLIQRRIRHLVLSPGEYERLKGKLENETALLLWRNPNIEHSSVSTTSSGTQSAAS
jgi:hypothetical protein